MIPLNDLFHYKGGVYHKFQKTGNSARFIMPFATEVCKGEGYDIGAGRPEWALPGSWIVDPAINGGDAMHLNRVVDYIFSSHCLEHLPNWWEVLKYWWGFIRVGGVLFLYLPDFSQKYWRPWNNPKHLHVLDKNTLATFIKEELYCEEIFVTGVDLNNSFAIVAYKQ